jgi:hypothetical protein
MKPAGSTIGFDHDRKRRKEKSEMLTKRIRGRVAVAPLAAALIALAAAVALATVAAASPEAAKKQRVAIMTGAGKTTLVSDFALFPLQGGPLEADTGKQVAKSHEGADPVILKGRRGTLVIRGTQKWAELGGGFSASTDTWQVLRGTGQYAGATGGGTGHTVWHAGTDDWSSRVEGVLTLP